MLRKQGLDIKAVAETNFKGQEDSEIAALAEVEDRIIITHDVGFGSMYYFSKRGKVGIMYFKNTTTNRRRGKFDISRLSEQSKLRKEKPHNP